MVENPFRKVRDSIRDRSKLIREKEQDALLVAEPAQQSLYQRYFDPEVRLLNTSDIMLRRHHSHLNVPIDRHCQRYSRKLSHSTVTTLILGACFTLGYSYARMRHDEYLRRWFYIRYTNWMIIFDK